MNDGTGYTDLSDQGIYSGVSTDTLHISNAATSMCGYKYRCTVTNNSNISYSDEYTLRFLLKWTGASDNAWENPANWSCNQVPDMYTDVIIDSGLVNYPVVNSNAACKSITVKPFTSVTVNSNYDLKIAGTP